MCQRTESFFLSAFVGCQASQRETCRFLRHLAPTGRLARAIGTACHCIATGVVGQKVDDFTRESACVVERADHADPVGQRFPGMPVRRGDDWLPKRDRVGQRARGDLSFGQVGGHIKVGSLEQIDQLSIFDEAVDEAEMVDHTQRARELHETVAVSFAFGLHEVRMGCPHDEINCVGVTVEDCGQAADDCLKSLVGGQEAERHDHLVAGEPERRLEWVGRREWSLRSAMRDDVNLGGAGAVHALKYVCAHFCHHDDGRRYLQDFIEHAFLFRVRVLQHRMQGGHDWHLQAAKKRQDVRA